MQAKELVIKDKKLFYRSVGEGPAVVLLHGFGEESWVWSNQLEALGNYHLIIPDLPGSGQSEMIDDMTMEGMAYCIQKMIIHETASVFFKAGEPHSVVVIGHSMGGYIALALAEKYPEMLHGFGLFHSTAYADSEEKKATRRKGIDFIQRNGAFEFLKTSIPNLYSEISKTEKKLLIENQIARSNNFSGEALVSYYEAMMKRPDRTEILKKSRVPVLFVLGKHDHAVPLKDGLKQCSLPDLAYIHVLESSGHMGMREEPGESNQILKNYLKAICHHAQ